MSQNSYEVVCNLAHAADEINGVTFQGPAGRKIAQAVSFEAASRFARIPGYTVTPPIDVNAIDLPPNDDSSEAASNEDSSDTQEGPEPKAPEPEAPPVATTETQPPAATGKPLADMTAPELKALLQADPDAYVEIEAKELEREKPRKPVLDAIAAAKTQLEQSASA